MNRYLATGVLEDLCAGKHVLFLTENRGGIRDAMDAVLDVVLDAGHLPESLLVHRANGHEGIRDRAGVGRITFSSLRSSHRDLSPDVVVFDCDGYAIDPDWWLEFRHTTGRNAELIQR